jgi:DNA modification methylase
MAELLPVLPIMMTTDEGDLVYDPFAGGNTVGRIALLLNRNYLSTELSNHYHKVGCKVIENTFDEINQSDFETLMSEVFGDEIETAA